MPIQDRASRQTARVAPYLDAITTARKAGLTWRDLAEVLGVQSPGALRQAVKSCKYKAEQIALPEPEKTKTTKTPAVQPQQKTEEMASVINKNLIS